MRTAATILALALLGAVLVRAQTVDELADKGLAKLRHGDLDGALADFDAALRLEPGNVSVLSPRGLARLHKGQLEEARADYDDYVRLDPRPFWAYRNRALMKALSGDREGARADLIRASELLPESPYPVLWLVALGADPALLEKTDDGKEWFSALARFYLSKITFQELVDLAHKGIDENEVQHRLCQAHCYLGLLYERDGDETHAREAYQAMTSRSVCRWPPRDGAPSMWTGMVLPAG